MLEASSTLNYARNATFIACTTSGDVENGLYWNGLSLSVLFIVISVYSFIYSLIIPSNVPKEMSCQIVAMIAAMIAGNHNVPFEDSSP
jgi:hypothetical protein